MAEYINKYANDAAIQAAVDGGELIKPYVALDENTGLIDWNTKFIDYASMPLTFEILSDGDIIWKASNGNSTKTIQYSKNGGEWISITSTTGGTTINVSKGDRVQFKGNNNGYSAYGKVNQFENTNQFKIIGNIMSLIDEVNYKSLTNFPSDYCFYNLFSNCTGLTDASNLILPTFTRTWCYYGMFANCTSLTAAPALPATTVKNACYEEMFKNCTSLTTAPELPATTLDFYVYCDMFRGCTNLNYIKCLATDISANSCTASWVNSVAATGTFVTPSTTNWTTGNSGIPSGWTRVNSD